MTEGEMWQWAQGPLMGAFYADEDNPGRVDALYGMNYVIGRIRLRQVMLVRRSAPPQEICSLASVPFVPSGLPRTDSHLLPNRHAPKLRRAETLPRPVAQIYYTRTWRAAPSTATAPPTARRSSRIWPTVAYSRRRYKGRALLPAL